MSDQRDVQDDNRTINILVFIVLCLYRAISDRYIMSYCLVAKGSLISVDDLNMLFSLVHNVHLNKIKLD